MPRRERPSALRIGVISDTHGVLHPRVAEIFGGVSAIVHAGDIGNAGILEQLGAIAPVTAVAGNVDGFRLGSAGLYARVVVGGLRIFLTHVLPRPSKPDREVAAELARERADVVIFGHSHLPHNEWRGDVWFFNPASAGPRRFDYPVSVGLFEKRGDEWFGWHVPLDERSREALAHRMNQLA